MPKNASKFRFKKYFPKGFICKIPESIDPEPGKKIFVYVIIKGENVSSYNYTDSAPLYCDRRRYPLIPKLDNNSYTILI